MNYLSAPPRHHHGASPPVSSSKENSGSFQTCTTVRSSMTEGGDSTSFALARGCRDSDWREYEEEEVQDFNSSSVASHDHSKDRQVVLSTSAARRIDTAATSATLKPVRQSKVEDFKKERGSVSSSEITHSGNCVENDGELRSSENIEDSALTFRISPCGSQVSIFRGNRASRSSTGSSGEDFRTSGILPRTQKSRTSYSHVTRAGDDEWTLVNFEQPNDDDAPEPGASEKNEEVRQYESAAAGSARKPPSLRNIMLRNFPFFGLSPIGLKLLANGQDIDKIIVDPKLGYNAIQAAVASGKHDTVKALIDLGADLTVKDVTRKKKSLLHLAAENGSRDTIKVLVAALKKKMSQKTLPSGTTKEQQKEMIGAPRSQSVILQEEVDVQGQTPLHYAAANNHVPVITFLIDTEPSLLERLDHNLLSAVHVAASKGCGNALRTLLTFGAKVDGRSSRGMTPLHFAVKAGSSDFHLDVIRHLLSSEATPTTSSSSSSCGSGTVATTREAVDEDGRSPLHVAAAVGNVPALQLLLLGRVVSSKSSADNSNSQKLVSGALERSSPISIRDIQPLPTSSLPSDQIKKKKEQDYLRFVNLVDKELRSALHLACWQGNGEAVKLLIACGAQADVKDIDDRQPVHLAAAKDKIFPLKVLLKTSLPGEITASSRDLLPFPNVSHHGNNSLSPSMPLHSVPDRQGRTPLHFAALNGCLSATRTLLEVGASPDVKDGTPSKQTPLHLAALKGHLEVVKVLLAAGASIRSILSSELPNVEDAEDEKGSDQQSSFPQNNEGGSSSKKRSSSEGDDGDQQNTTNLIATVPLTKAHAHHQVKFSMAF